VKTVDTSTGDVELESKKPVKVAVIGCTGSIGTQALEVIEKDKSRFEVVALCAGQNVDLLEKQISKFRPRFAGIAQPDLAGRLKKNHDRLEVATGQKALEIAATLDEVDLAIIAVVGFAGVVPTLKALQAGKKVALANKETLVAAGELIMQYAHLGRNLLPIDSEHSALFQLLKGVCPGEVNLLGITGSGGPFRNAPKEVLSYVTPQEALKHPTWNMGAKISIDSATLMNKGLEVIEAMHLFSMDLSKIRVLIHPQSRIHGLIELNNGSWLAHMSEPDMRLSITDSLYYPDVPPRSINRLDLTELGKLEFFEVDNDKFPCLDLAIKSAEIGQSMPVVLNAANEEAVYAFLYNKISFTQIPRIIERVMNDHQVQEVTLDNLLAADNWARKKSKECIMSVER
jgi:1-deoxy-D-xylulose-5-phosphate reductoisomerase